jgi:dihydroorotate dehydrogenase
MHPILRLISLRPILKTYDNFNPNNQLHHLLNEFTLAREQLIQKYSKRTPIFLKIAPDLNNEEIEVISSYIDKFQIDALIATNTTISREKVSQESLSNEAGGLSGAPLRDLSNQTIKQFHHYLGNTVPIIGVGGIMNGTDALEKKIMGAKAIQIYSGLIYRGPSLIQECISALDPN